MASAAMPELITQWTERDYNAAAAWLGKAPNSAPWKDAAVAALVKQIQSVDPDAARAWSATIKNPALRPEAK